MRKPTAEDGITGRLRRRYGRDGWRVVTTGCSGARVYRAGRWHVKLSPVTDHPDPGFRLGTERLALDWLAGTGTPAPRVVDHGVVDGYEWLVTDTVPGRSAAEPWPAHQRPAVIDALAATARDLHALPVDDCPLDRRLSVRIPAAERSVAAGLVDLSRLDARRRGWTGHRLLAELHASRPAYEDLVVCHGDLCLPNVLLDPDTVRVTGIVDVGRLGVADRHTDLALAARSIGDSSLNPQYGQSFVDRFLTGYGTDRPDDDRIAFYQLLDEFC